MNKAIFNLSGIMLAVILTLALATSCGSKSASTIIQAYTLLTEDQAIKNAEQYVPSDIISPQTKITAVLDTKANIDGEWHVTFGFYNQLVTTIMLDWPEIIGEFGPNVPIYEAEVVVDAKTGIYLLRSVSFNVHNGPIPTNITTP